MKNDKEVKKIKKKVPKTYVITVLFILIVFVLIVYKMRNSEEKYLVNEGTIEYTTSCMGYVIKSETTIDIDNTKVLIPALSDGSRVSKNNIIATYKGSEYEDYQTKLKEIDAKILDAMKDIDVEYSIDVSNLESQVVNAVSSSQGTTSMVKMQEYKTSIGNLLSKRASIVGSLSPEDAYVKQLIKEREDIESKLKTSSSNIKASIGGIVSYTVDGLEDKLTEETALKLSYDEIKEYVNNKKTATNKIRITSNYEAYIMIKVDNTYKEYMKEDNSYELKIVGEELNILKGTIKKLKETEEGYEVLFRITNGIENIVDSRECELEVVWTTYEGLVVPINAIFEGTDGREYVKIITRGEYVDIPVKVEQKNNTYAVVSNYDKENVNDYILERYDQVIIGRQ